MTIGICSDHAGFDYKSRLIPYLEKMGYAVEDFGTHSTESMDFRMLRILWLRLLKVARLIVELQCAVQAMEWL